jgi:hypothetical protein
MAHALDQGGHSGKRGRGQHHVNYAHLLVETRGKKKKIRSSATFPFPAKQQNDAIKKMTEISDEELIRTIGEFIELGHVENIVAMFKQEPDYYRFTGELLRDERFMVRMGVVILFEELAIVRPDDISLAIPFLLPLLNEEEAFIRGEAVTVLGIIGTDKALNAIKPLVNDPEAQIVELVQEILN